MKTILVTGANGQLGNEMRIVAKDSNDHYKSGAVMFATFSAATFKASCEMSAPIPLQ